MPAKKEKKKTTPGSGAKYLVIVESPAKSKTINKILGSDYKVLASMGHIVDLPADRMGIDFDNGFTPEYAVMKGRKKYLTILKKEAKGSEIIYLAADPDREGEAICWHLKNQLTKGVKAKIVRVSFEEITQKAVKKAFEEPREIDMNKVNAQQARRILDRIVGYSLSPLLWKKITRGLSAGRVQSVAVKLIVDRENEIKDFISQEYWSVEALLKKKEPGDVQEPFTARLVKHKGEKINIPDQKSIDKVMSDLEKEKFIVAGTVQKERKSHPGAPYKTSDLQQDAFNKINFSASKTMRVAQSLYEGIELGAEGSVGLITYMRTDSVRIADDAQKEAKSYILDKYGEEYYPKIKPQYRSKKGAQEAHEAIRPTLPLRSPREVESYMGPDELKLYSLIWKKFISSQMTSALYNVVTVNIDAGEYRLHAGGGRLMFDGFLKVYRDGGEKSDEVPEIPHLEDGEEVDPVEIIPEQHFTKPPPRYSDASLVKVLEEKGIGRPSTYAPIIRTIIDRHYVKRTRKNLNPTELGELVNELLVSNFSDILEYQFTAKMEDELDGVEAGKIEWVSVIKEFYGPFSKKIEESKKTMSSVKKQVTETDEVCEQCGRPMVIKWGRRGRFLSCAGFPACKNAKSITTGVKCPEEGCGGDLVERKSKRGMFYGCTNYPKCTYTNRNLPSEGKSAEDAGDQVEGG